MSFERILAIIALLSGAFFSIMMGSGVVSACEASGWSPAATPRLSCLGLAAIADGEFDAHNYCSDPVELSPEGCDEPCSEAISVASNTTVVLVLPAAAKGGDRQVFNYKRSEQTGRLEFTYNFNDCASEEDSGGGCSTASTGQGSAIHQAGILSVFLALLGCWRRHHRAREADEKWKDSEVEVGEQQRRLDDSCDSDE